LASILRSVDGDAARAAPFLFTSVIVALLVNTVASLLR
jgi:hypothetical protein